MLTSAKTNVIAKHIIENFIIFEERKGVIVNPYYLIFSLRARPEIQGVNEAIALFIMLGFALLNPVYELIGCIPWLDR